MPKVLVIGTGIAGLSCAQLLANRGWEIEIWGKHQLFAPTLILNQITCNLLQDIWQLERNFWDGLHLLHERKVCWGKDREVLSMAEPSVVINGKSLSDRLWHHLLEKYHHQIYIRELPIKIDDLDRLQADFDWVIDAGGRQSAIAEQLGTGHRYTFGNRCILSQEVQLTDAAPEDIYWIETVPAGWLFLAPLGNQKAILQAMVPLISGQSLELLIILLKQSRHIQQYIGKISESIAIFPGFPQILQPLVGKKYLAVGDAAFAVDPISGDGTGYAIRGAILATSIIDTIAAGLPSSDCLEHYSLRLETAFTAHLQQCLEYYSNGFASSLWQAEIERMQTEYNRWNPIKNQQFTHTLKDFQLVKIP
jgi:2-polyprenyl-6-methoxyphenol hydroxylase-like FAD-dependent oxidoreductase